jgi:hypothetical protein
MLHIPVSGVSKTFGEWYQKTNKTEDTNKLTLLAFKIIAILHNTRLAKFIKLLETVSKGLFRNRSQNSCHTLLDCRRTAEVKERVELHLYSPWVSWPALGPIYCCNNTVPLITEPFSVAQNAVFGLGIK